MNEEISCLKRGLDKRGQKIPPLLQRAGKYAICNHLAKLHKSNSNGRPTNNGTASFNHKKGPICAIEPFL